MAVWGFIDCVGHLSGLVSGMGKIGRFLQYRIDIVALKTFGGMRGVELYRKSTK